MRDGAKHDAATVGCAPQNLPRTYLFFMHAFGWPPAFVDRFFDEYKSQHTFGDVYSSKMSAPGYGVSDIREDVGESHVSGLRLTAPRLPTTLPHVAVDTARSTCAGLFLDQVAEMAGSAHDEGNVLHVATWGYGGQQLISNALDELANCLYRLFRRQATW